MAKKCCSNIWISMARFVFIAFEKGVCQSCKQIVIVWLMQFPSANVVRFVAPYVCLSCTLLFFIFIAAIVEDCWIFVRIGFISIKSEFYFKRKCLERLETGKFSHEINCNTSFNHWISIHFNALLRNSLANKLVVFKTIVSTFIFCQNNYVILILLVNLECMPFEPKSCRIEVIR